MSAPLDLLAKWHVAQAWAQEKPRLTHGALQVLLRLLDHQNPKTGRCNPSIPTLARAVNISERSVRSATRELKNRGAIEVSRPKDSRSNHYRMNFPSQVSGSGQLGGRKPTSTKPEAGFHNEGKQLSAKTIKEKTKKKEVDGGRGERRQGQPGWKACEDSEKPLESRAREEDRFHKEITVQLEQDGMAYEDLLNVDDEILSEAFKDLIAGRERREELVEKVVLACSQAKRERT